ncbi:hypothetical protein GCM10023189_22630 [Nibrella saemangeumensis]|uniref:HTH luxR-type domain-containing protein n=1 Tax=Nibrella saemangeumensis TaxID=1084526 RepID=A0ABP8MUS1_9BACT
MVWPVVNNVKWMSACQYLQLTVFFLLSSFAYSVASPDSLLTLSSAQQLKAVIRVYNDLSKKDTNAANRFRQELAGFYEKNGSENDKLTFQTAILCTDRANMRYNNRFPARAQALLQTAERINNASLMARINLQMGLYQFNIAHNYYLTFKHYLRTFDLLKTLTEADFPERDYTIYLIARAYYEFFDYENAIRIGKVLTDAKPDGIANTHIYNTCMLGMASVKLKDYPAARRYFEWGLQHLPVRDFNNEAWVGILNGNIGLLLTEQQQENAAMPYLSEGIRLTTQTQVWDNAAIFGSKLATIYLNRNQLTRAGELARQAHQAALKMHMVKFSHVTYQVLADYYRKAGQTELAFRYADSAAFARDGYKRDIDVTLKHKAEMAVESERHQLQERIMQKEKERQVLLRNSIILLIALALVVTWLLYNRRLLQYRHRQQQLLAENKRTEFELKNAIGQLDQFTRNIQEKSVLIDQFSEQIRQMEQQLHPVADAHYQLLEQLQNSVLLTDEGWEEFRQLFEKVHQGYLVRLRDKLPGLSPAEVRFMALCKLNYSNKEMAAMLGVSTHAIRQHRSRLRRKLNLTEEIEIEELAATI